MLGIPDICSTMTFDFGHICQATNREPEELTVQSPCNGLANGSLANSRWTHEANDLSLYCSPKLSYSKELQNTIFDVFESVMIFIENCGRILN
jgi:hypothetical protein